MVMQSSFLLVLIGIGIGLVGSLFLTRLLSGMLYGIGARDPMTFVAVAAGLFVVGLIAAWVPAHRATRVEPVEALRQE
jgi:putative ABC transport system permease protein